MNSFHGFRENRVRTILWRSISLELEEGVVTWRRHPKEVMGTTMCESLKSIGSIEPTPLALKNHIWPHNSMQLSSINAHNAQKHYEVVYINSSTSDSMVHYVQEPTRDVLGTNETMFV